MTDQYFLLLVLWRVRFVVIGEHQFGPLAGKLTINARTILDVNPFEFE